MNKSKHTFFCPEIKLGVLNEDESGHASRVLRLQISDVITIVDGKGGKFESQITSISKKQVGFQILNEEQVDDPELSLHIAIAPTKSNDRFNFFLEKCTELSLKEISPIQCSNSERKIFKRDKSEKTLVSALKQSGNLYLPQLNELQGFKNFVSSDFGSSKKFIAHCEEDSIKHEFKDLIENVDENIIILIGPEGDFTTEEINLAKDNGFLPVSLGKSRLRTETAGIVACHTAYLRY